MMNDHDEKRDLDLDFSIAIPHGLKDTSCFCKRTFVFA